MPSLNSTSRCRLPRLLIVGCGDVGQRVLRMAQPAWRVLALCTSAQRADLLRGLGATPLLGNLDDPCGLARLASLADAVLHLAPPPGQGSTDTRTQALLTALSRGVRPRCLVYVSTSGVYGDCGGARFDETRAIRPATDRARRRADAEARVRWFGRAMGVRVSVLRVPGIYALDRPGGDPRERLLRGAPVLVAQDDVYTNHIHADDLARVCLAALSRGAAQRVYHASDDTELKMADYFDLAARLCGMVPPTRVTRAQAEQQLGALPLSFMSESRRLDNRRIKTELRVALRYPTVAQGLARSSAPA